MNQNELQKILSECAAERVALVQRHEAGARGDAERLGHAGVVDRGSIAGHAHPAPPSPRRIADRVQGCEETAARAAPPSPSCFHPDCDRRPRSLTESAPRSLVGVAGCTAGREFHPTLQEVVL